MHLNRNMESCRMGDLFFRDYPNAGNFKRQIRVSLFFYLLDITETHPK